MELLICFANCPYLNNHEELLAVESKSVATRANRCARSSRKTIPYNCLLGRKKLKENLKFIVECFFIPERSSNFFRNFTTSEQTDYHSMAL